jgi:hypothetical protein
VAVSRVMSRCCEKVDAEESELARPAGPDRTTPSGSRRCCAPAATTSLWSTSIAYVWVIAVVIVALGADLAAR